jgi:hypothetical protein
LELPNGTKRIVSHQIVQNRKAETLLSIINDDFNECS